MRTIKFRAKVKYNGDHYESGQWVKGSYAFFDGMHQIYDDEEYYIAGMGDHTRYTWVEIDEITLGQYTDLSSLDGVDIYEDDIMARIACPQRHTLSCVCKKEVDERFVDFVRYLDGSFEALELEHSIDSYHIIGNIHDNPELIKE